MANIKYTNGTLFMALEEGASWPQFMRQLRKTAGNVHAVVQAPGEPAEAFATRVLERWQALIGKSVPPHRFVLGTNESWDSTTAAARLRLARAAMGPRNSQGPAEFVLWGGNISNSDDQGRLLALAGALVEGELEPSRNVRVLFREPVAFVKQSVSRARSEASLCVA